MPSINEIQDEIIEEFSELDDWMDRYQLLIDLGNEQQPLPAEDKNDQNLIDGCQSRLWLACSQNEDGTLCFRAESDALIVKGIVSLLIRVLSGHTPDEILNADRTARPPLAHTQQRLAVHAEANAHVRPCLQGKKRSRKVKSACRFPENEAEQR